jgi:hypothetical protein
MTWTSRKERKLARRDENNKNTTMATLLIMTFLSAFASGFQIAVLIERWRYYKKTGKHLQDL